MKTNLMRVLLVALALVLCLGVFAACTPPEDDPTKAPVVRWRSAGMLIYTNWLNYYVYQSTPYDLTELKDDEA